MDKQIQMAASRGLGFFSFYAFFSANDGSSWNPVINKFKNSSHKSLMKYMFAILLSEEKTALITNQSRFTDNVISTVLKYLADPNDPTKLDPSILTDKSGRPIIGDFINWYDDLNGVYESHFGNNQTVSETNHRVFIKKLKQAVIDQYKIEPVYLFVDSRAFTSDMLNDYVNPMKNSVTLNSSFSVTYNSKHFDGFMGFHSEYQNSEGANYESQSNPQTPNYKNHLNDHISLASNIYYMPGIDVGFDNRTIYGKSYYTNITTQGFTNYLNQAKGFMDNNNDLTQGMAIVYAWNEWAESGILEPSVGDQYSKLDALQNTFNLSSKCPTPDLKIYTNYSNWSQEKLLPAAKITDDTDGDEVINFWEYFFGLDPNKSDETLQNGNCSIVINSPNSDNKFDFKYDFEKNDLSFYFQVYHSWDSVPSWKNYAIENRNGANNPLINTLLTEILPDQGSNVRLIGYQLPYKKGDNIYCYPPELCNSFSPNGYINDGELSTLNIARKGNSYTDSDNVRKDKVSFYLNAAKDNLEISWSGESATLIEIYNCLGQKLREKILPTESTTELDLFGISKGLYFIIYVENGVKKSFKLEVE